MPPLFVSQLLGYVGSKPNTADGDSRQSVAIAEAVLQILDLTDQVPGGQRAGSSLEAGVHGLLAMEMIRHRRGRQPHIVTVTSEPLPSRLAAICRGTGEVDAVYHVCLPELTEAVEAVGNATQAEDLAESVGQHRLFDLGDLSAHLTL